MRLVAGNIPVEEVDQWDVRDACTGSKVMAVNWADDSTHQIEICGCAYGCREVIGKPGCSNGVVYSVPKVLILVTRKLILINVHEEWRDEDLFRAPVSEEERRERDAAWERQMVPQR